MGLLSGITDAIGLTDSGAGEKAARQAGRITQEQTDKAREAFTSGFPWANAALNTGYLESIKQLNRGGLKSYLDLVGAESASRDDLSTGFGDAIGRLDPVAQTGLGALQALEAGATPEGFVSNVQNLQNSGVLAPLIESNQRDLEAQLAAQGLTRSGIGVQELSQIPIETILGIEGNLQNRQGQLAQ